MAKHGLLLCCYSAGGVTLLAMDGKITVVNTLESRLELLAAQVCVPALGLLAWRHWCIHRGPGRVIS